MPQFLPLSPVASSTPHHNRLLAALPKREFRRLQPHLELVRLPAGSTVYAAGEREQFVHFPTSGLVCRMLLTTGGAYTGFSVTGREGVIGIASILGGESTLSQALVLCPGHAFRIGSGRLQAEIERGSALAQLLMRYAQALIAQAGQVAACTRHHSLRQRICFWILSCVDRLQSDKLPVTQEVIAHIAGVRREAITHAVGELQAAKLIRCHRGGVSILHRAGLEAQVCECYPAVRREQGRLFSPALQRATALMA